MNTDDKRLLASIVASLEALFTPYRYDVEKRTDKACAAIMSRRSDYRNGKGIAWTIGGDGKDRQRGYLALKRLQSAGLVRLHPGKSVQRAGVSLRRVDACLSVCPIKLVRESWPILQHLAELEANPHTLKNCGFVREHDVVGLDHDSTEGTLSEKFANQAMPLLIACLVETASDVQGAIGWRLTPVGREALAAGESEPVELLEYDTSLSDEYFARVDVGLADRRDWAGNPSSVTIPLSCGLWMANRTEAAV